MSSVTIKKNSQKALLKKEYFLKKRKSKSVPSFPSKAQKARPVYGDRNFTEEEWAFVKAMHCLKLRLGRYPMPPEILAEAISLGYRKVVKQE